MPQPTWCGFGRGARALVLGLGGLVLLAAGAAAQVRPPVQPPPGQRPQQPPLPGRDQLKEAPTFAGPDLVIDKVTVTENNTASAGIQVLYAEAWVTLRNAGRADAVFPGGSIVLKSAPSSGGLRFRDDTARAGLTLKPGATVTERVGILNPCQGWGSAPVSFSADPGNVVGEVQRGNNTASVSPAVSNPAASDLVVAGLSFVKPPKSGEWSDLQVTVKNAGTGPVLVCPGTVVFKESASPVSAKYGLRSYTFQAPAGATPAYSSSSGGAVQTDVATVYPFVVIQPGSTRAFYLANACRLGDMSSPAQWKVTLNPSGTIREGNRGNNEGTAQLTPCT